MTIVTYHSFLFLDVRSYEIMKKKERFSVDSHEYMILEFRNEAAFDQRLLT